MRKNEDAETALEEILLGLPCARRGRMFGHTAFFAGRKMFACLYGGGIALRLSRAEVHDAAAAVLEFRPHGRRMWNWVLLVYRDPQIAARDRDLFRQAAEKVRC